MVWTAEKSQGFEVRKCRNRVIEFLRGTILDIGCGDEKIVPKAIGVDIGGKEADLRVDLSQPNALWLFNSNAVDVVFSSHFLEDIYDAEGALKEFWRIIRPNGYLILYLPHKELYPNIGAPHANPNHKHDFIPQDILDMLDKFASYRLIRNRTYNEGDEYSFEIIAQKLDTGKIKLRINDTPAKTGKEAVVVRYGGYGDMIIVSPLFRLLKINNYKVIVNTIPQSIPVIENNPYIDEFLIQEKGAIPATQLGDYFKELEKKYDRVINLCESIERTLLFEERDKELFNLPKEERHKRANVNYYDRALEIAGFGHLKGLRGELYLSETEEKLCQIFLKKHEGAFKVLWATSGSSWHKLYPYCDAIMEELLEELPDIKFFIVGGEDVRILNWSHPRLCNRLGIWNIRQSIIMPKFMELVVSPETGVLNAAGCFNTPKIGLLTHSSKENLTKYFTNDYSVESNAECSPCHRLVHTLELCPLDKKFELPICMSEGMPKEEIKKRIKFLYEQWKKGESVCLMVT